ncbi:MAG: carbohydrate kinase [Fibrobacter sp.]|nr:carbohydrate kinase [Fibrobacter sp.]
MTFKVAGTGEILWDLFPSGKRLGGAPANFCYHARMLGAEAFVVSRAGFDDAGEEIISELNSLGLSSDYVSLDKKHPTGSVSVSVDQNGIPDYKIKECVAWDHIVFDRKEYDLAKAVDAVSFGTLAQRCSTARLSIVKFLENSRKDALRIFDINLRMNYYSSELIERSLQLCNVLKINDNELDTLASFFSLSGSYEEMLSGLVKRYNLRIAALTRGGNGSILCTPEEISVHPGFPVTVCDTVGAGDAFTAALAIGLLKEESLSSINESANRIASYVCRFPGATPPCDSFS